MPSPQFSENNIDSESADALTIQKIQKGDKLAFKRIYIDNAIPLVRYVTGLLNSVDGAEDIVQDVFASIWERRRSWNPKGKIVAYLYKAVRNRTLNVLEHDGVISRIADENRSRLIGYNNHGNEYVVEAIHYPVMLGGSPVQLPNQSLEQTETHEKIIAAINTLPERRRLAILLRAVHELEYGEIAEAMEISERAVRILVSRAREELREILGDSLS